MIGSIGLKEVSLSSLAHCRLIAGMLKLATISTRQKGSWKGRGRETEFFYCTGERTKVQYDW